MRALDATYNLTVLANRAGTDKGTVGELPHRYTPFYEMLLGPRRGTIRRMLEIGLLVGGPEVGQSADRATGAPPSIQMWLDYFPEAEIDGFDISDFSAFRDPRFRFVRGDSGVRVDLERLVEDGRRYDFVIDDGSHASFHQQLAFLTLFPHVAPGGLYIIEDLHWQSPFYEDALPPTVRTAEMFAHWYAHGAFPDMATAELAGLHALVPQIGYAFIVDQPLIPERRPKVVVIQKAWA